MPVIASKNRKSATMNNSIKLLALIKMPKGHPSKPFTYIVEDMDGKKVECVHWIFMDGMSFREAMFCIKTGRC